VSRPSFRQESPSHPRVDYRHAEVVANCFASSAFGLDHQLPCPLDRQEVRRQDLLGRIQGDKAVVYLMLFVEHLTLFVEPAVGQQKHKGSYKPKEVSRPWKSDF
jgi:hypothetical protein